MKIANPIVQKIHDNESSLKKFENIMNKKKIKDNIILTHYPVVYIHVWKNKDNYELYVGESNNIFQRTRNHYKNSKSNNNWQNNLITKNADLYIIGHEHFNKSLTLDIENKLYHYLSGVESVSKIYNARGNPQNQYYTANEFNKIFQKIWDKLRDYNANLFPYENKILDSAIFKSSPFHKLTKDQNNLKDLIVNKMAETIVTQKKGQLIFIEGESGTGKTVLNSSTFYEIYNYKETSLEEDQNQFESLNKKLDCNLIINNNEQFKVYKRIFKKLCDDKTELVYKATRFINRHSKDKPVDISFVDEAHLLLTHGKQSYKGKNQLQDIMDRSKITIIMFDPLQIQNIDQYWEHKVIMKYKKMAK